MKRGEYKKPGGKLIAVNVRVDADGVPVECNVDGDFFIVGGNQEQQTAFLNDIGRALVSGESVDLVFGEYESVHMVGADAEGIDIAYRRALDAADGDALSATNRSFHAYDANIKTFDDNDAADDLMSFDWHERWRSLKPLVVIDKPRGAKDQMALDQRLAREVAQGIRPATLRFWNWSEPAVVVGRFQSIPDQVDTDQARRLGFNVVRRSTGGGTMFVQPQGVITYSLYAPMDFVAGVSVSQSYKLCDAWLIAALEGLGFDARFSGLNDISSMYGKIGGSAQRRYFPQKGGSGAVLHHTMLDWDLDAALMARVLKVSQEKLSDKAVPSAVKRVDALSRQTSLTQDEITNRLFAFVSGGI